MSAGPGVLPVNVIPGRVHITARALSSLARAVAADGLGAPVKRVRVGVTDDNGALAVDVVGPIAATTDVVSAAASAAEAIRERVGDLSGRRVGRTDVELTGIVRRHEGRVR